MLFRSAYTRDLTPTQDNNWERAKTAGSGGGAKDFLTFIEGEVRGLINQTYNVNKYDQTLVGHSFGGLFGLYVLLTSPESFKRYVLASPSLWWDNNMIFKLEKQYAGNNTNLTRRVFLAVGSEEAGLGTKQMVKNTRLMFDSIKRRNYAGLDIGFKVFEGESHQSVVATSMREGIKSVFQEHR